MRMMSAKNYVHYPVYMCVNWRAQPSPLEIDAFDTLLITLKI